MTEWRQNQQTPYRSYRISDEGEVRRCGGKSLVGYVDRYGYRTVLLSYAGLSRRFKVHRLVCEAFHGPPPSGTECAHLDGNPLNNCAANLAWVTPAENAFHKKVQGRPNGGPISALSEESIAEIKQSPLSSRAVARQFGISQPHVVRIRNGTRLAKASRNVLHRLVGFAASIAIARKSA